MADLTERYGLLGGRLAARMLAKDLNPMREALLASQAESTTLGQPAQMGQQSPPPMLTGDGAAIPGTEPVGQASPLPGTMPAQRAPYTPRQQMIMQAAQDPREFARLAGGTEGAMQLAEEMKQAPRIREIVVHPGDALNERLGLGLKDAESAVVAIQYDENDRQLPGFTIEQYVTSAANTEATTNNRQQYPAGPLGQWLLLEDLKAAQGMPPGTPQEAENYFNEARYTATVQQDYKRWKDDQIANGVAEADLPDYTDWKMTHGAGDAFAGVFGESEGKRLAEYTTKAQAALPAIASIERGFELIDKGLVAGAGADARLGLVRAIDTILGRETDAKSATTDAYMAASGQRVAEQITAFGAGTGLSDADRDFARLITGGQITMTPQALRMALEILARGKLGEIQRYNEVKGGLKGNFALLRPMMPEIVAPNSIYARLSPLKDAPEGMDDSQRLNFFLSQRPSYMAPTTGTAQSLPPPAGEGPGAPRLPTVPGEIMYDSQGNLIQ